MKKINKGYTIQRNRYKHSSFEEDTQPNYPFTGVTRATPNTINGPWAENRGRRTAGHPSTLSDSPFDDGLLYNWNHRDSPDEARR